MADTFNRIAEYGKQVDFGKTADDYGRYRAGFPGELYRRLKTLGLGLPRQRVLDLGTGTGYLGRGLARQGCLVTGLDISPALMEEARRLDAAKVSRCATYVREPKRSHSKTIASTWSARASAGTGSIAGALHWRREEY
jgi:2-polyprenyl-3-methyl-5-hydroxy-6-metoxy-1,4-benzoquinol methylase